MLLCGIESVEPGMMLGAPVVRPDAPDTELLKPGVSLDPPMLARLRSLGVVQLWVQDDLTKDLDRALSPEVAEAKTEVLRQLKGDLAAASRRAVTAADVHTYKQAVLGMVCRLIGDAKYASMTDAIFTARDLASHSTNVAYLSVIAGLELETYLVKEQPRLPANHARDASVLGLAGMLHDLGKCRLTPRAAEHHESQHAEGFEAPEGYLDHTVIGYRMLSESRASPRATQAVLNHHQRFDGRGWPDMSVVTNNRRRGTQFGHQIHVFTRIVAAANVLDNLLRTADGQRRPPVAALHEFASAKFEGWFDPMVRRALLRRIPPFAVGSDVRLSDGRRAVVTAPSTGEPCRPMVRVRCEGSESAENIDLAVRPEVSITACQGVNVTGWVYSIPTLAEVIDPSDDARSDAGRRAA